MTEPEPCTNCAYRYMCPRNVMLKRQKEGSCGKREEDKGVLSNRNWT